MRVPLSWLKEFIEINHSPETIAEALTLAGLEVDKIETILPSFEKVVCVQVKETRPHPEAEKLSIATVFDGSDTFQIVCGAPNCRKGLYAALAKVGAKLTLEDGKILKIKKSKLRGVESQGMLCSGKELQISKDATGIVELNSDTPIGSDLAQAQKEIVFEISLTPNLNHCNSILGVARELSAILDIPFKFEKTYPIEEKSSTACETLTVKIEDKHLCPRYTTRLIKNISLNPTPEFIQKRLIHCGLKPINSVVDITNYVLMELGHPLHAFDSTLIKDNTLVVRKSKAKEGLTTLDSIYRELPTDTILICDSQKPVAMAGIMGGENSEVNEQTVSIILESAYFDPIAIRKASKKSGLSTEASKRFERGTDPNLLTIALNKASFLIQKYCQGTVCQKIYDTALKPFENKQISCRLDKVNAILGIQLSLEEVQAIFSRLNFAYTVIPHKNILQVSIPTYRCDIFEEIDLVEEVAKIHGFDNIPQINPSHKHSSIPHAPIYCFENKVIEKSLYQGLQEFISCDLISPLQSKLVLSDHLKQETLIKVLNPTSVEQSILRPSLLPGLLQCIKSNQDHNISNISCFEVGRIHFKQDDVYKEQSMLAVLLTGKSFSHHWHTKPLDVDFFDLKGKVENILESLSIDSITFTPSSHPCFHPMRQASISVDQDSVGLLGELHPSILKTMGLKQKIYFAELNINYLLLHHNPTTNMKPLPLYPCSERDWTVTLDQDLAVGTLLSFMQEIPSKLLETVTLRDIYEKLEDNTKNVTFRFTYRDSRKTVSFKSVENEHQRIIKVVSDNFLSLSSNLKE